MDNALNLSEAADLIAAVGHEVTVMLAGEPGIGKSAILSTLGQRFPDRELIYFDCATKDLGDIQYPDVQVFPPQAGADTDAKRILKFIPNAQLGIHTGKPAIICLDELGKCASRAVLNALLSVIHERRLGDDYMHPETILFTTTNLTTDGVGDIIPAHVRSRMCTVTVSKPNAEQWIAWTRGLGRSKNIHPMVTAYVEMFPQALASYTEGDVQKDNPRIYHPDRQQTAYVTPRTLEKASHVIRAQAKFSTNALTAALAGLGGAAFAREMQDFLAVREQMPSMKEVIEDPQTAKLPDTASAAMVLVHGMIGKMDRKNFDPFFEYIMRLPKEVQAVFFVAVIQTQGVVDMAVKKKAFQQWASDNAYLF